MHKRAQGSIEYLTALGIVAVLGLVVVVLATNFLPNEQNISLAQSKQYWAKQAISIIDEKYTSDGSGKIVLQNNTSDPLTILEITIDDINNSVNKRLLNGESYTFDVIIPGFCTPGEKVSHYVKITYVTEYGATQVFVGELPLVSICTQSTDTTPPVVTLRLPVDANYMSSTQVFYFDVNDTSALRYCDLNVSQGATYSTKGRISTLAPGINKSVTATTALTNGDWNWGVTCTDGAYNVGYSARRLIHVDTSIPSVTIYAPADGNTNLDGNTTFIYKVSDASPITECHLWFYPSTYYDTNYTITKDINLSFFETLAQGTYHWNIGCTDAAGNLGYSPTGGSSGSNPGNGIVVGAVQCPSGQACVQSQAGPDYWYYEIASGCMPLTLQNGYTYSFNQTCSCTSNGNCILIDKNSVTLDCNGFAIVGSGSAVAGTSAVGVRVTGVDTNIHDCNISNIYTLLKVN